MQKLIVIFFLFTIDCIYFVLLLSVCFLFWNKYEHSQKNFMKTETITTVVQKSEINLKCFKIDNSDSDTSEETVTCIAPIKPVSDQFFSDFDLFLDSCPDSTENINLTSAPPVSETNATFIDTGFTVQFPGNSEKINSSSENILSPTVTVQRPPLSR